MSNPRIGSKVRIRSTGVMGKIYAHGKLVSGEKIFFVEYDKPDKDGHEAVRVRYSDVEVVR